jgi:hypothetical protein
MSVFQSFNYYHPEQRGSCSLKAVLPAIRKHRLQLLRGNGDGDGNGNGNGDGDGDGDGDGVADYTHLSISNGNDAALRFASMLRAAQQQQTSSTSGDADVDAAAVAAEVAEVREALLAYCKLDTHAMVLLHDALSRIGAAAVDQE